MSTTTAAGTVDSSNWGLWRRQIGGILRLELRKALLGKRALLLYLLAALPVAGAGLWAVGTIYFGADKASPQMASSVFAPIYSYFILGTVVYFGCVWIFMNLFRGEILDRSLHYYMLSAVRREVLVVGKFLAAWIASALLFAGATLVSYLLVFLPFGTAGFSGFILGGPGLGHLVGYLGITVLACAGYGALFLLLGLFLRNPVLPALLICGWELIHFLLPPLLKKFSVIHYLKSLFPVLVPEGPFSVPGEPSAPWVAIGGLLVFASALLVLAALKARRVEMEYGDD